MPPHLDLAKRIQIVKWYTKHDSVSTVQWLNVEEYEEIAPNFQTIVYLYQRFSDMDR